MCGIAGWISFQEEVREHASDLAAMSLTLSRRGPDDSGEFLAEHCGLVHRRLAVVDPEHGAQPMCLGPYTLVYNGELYNAAELTGALRAHGWEFLSHSDTEVLLKSYLEWGPDCLTRLSGIFAFAVWDEREQTLFAARDRMGVKPFFYHTDPTRFVFGSEIPTLLTCPFVPHEVDDLGRRQLMLLGPGRLPGSGVLRTVRELKPGCWLSYGRKGLRTGAYWKLRARPHTEGEAESAEHLRQLVTDAARRQLVSDVPLCCMLSGGLDSSILSALAAERYASEGRRLDTYSVDYQENDKYFQSTGFTPGEDAPYAREMSEHIGSRHHAVILSNVLLAQALPDAALARGLPGMADVDSSLMLFCREIKRDFTVGLSGECADELFGGYPWYHRPEILYEECFPWSRTTDVRALVFRRDALPEHGEEWLQETYRDALKAADLLPGEDRQAVRMRQMFRLNLDWFMQTLLEGMDWKENGGCRALDTRGRTLYNQHQEVPEHAPGSGRSDDLPMQCRIPERAAVFLYWETNLITLHETGEKRWKQSGWLKRPPPRKKRI